MLILDRIISIYAPFSCLGCGVEKDRLLCPACVETVPIVPSRCYRCKSVTRDYSVCARCRQHTGLRRVVVAVHYEGLAKELLHAAKYARAVRGLSEMAAMMTTLIGYFQDGEYDYIVPVPTATSRTRQRGYDHAEVLARHIARTAALPSRSLLMRFGQAHQVGSGRTARIKQLEGALRVAHAARVKGKRLLLVDDVITTGATVESAAAVLKKAGAARVDALVFAQPNNQ